MVAVCLVVEGINFEDDATLQTIGEQFADLGWGARNGIETVTVYVDNGKDLTSEVIQIARKIECQVPGANVARVYTDQVTQADIAHRVGVSREAVSKWTKRTGPKAFPAPFDTITETGNPRKLWLWRHVAKWLQNVQGIDMGEDCLDDKTVAGIDACLAGAPGYHERELHTFAGTKPVSSRVPAGLPADFSFSSADANFAIHVIEFKSPPHPTGDSDDERSRSRDKFFAAWRSSHIHATTPTMWRETSDA